MAGVNTRKSRRPQKLVDNRLSTSIPSGYRSISGRRYARARSPRPDPAGPEIVPGGLSADSSIEASSPSAMFFLNDLMPFAKSPIRLLTLPPPNSSNTTSSTTIQCQMLKLPIKPPRHGALCRRQCPPTNDMARCRRGCKRIPRCRGVAADASGMTGYCPPDCRTDCEEG